MSKKTRSQKAARKTKTADFEIFEDRSPQERGYLGFYTSITPRVLKNARESIQTGNMLDLERVFRSMKIEWPRLRGNLRKLREKVQALELTVSPWAEKGKKPTPTASRYADLVESALYCCRLEQGKWELDLNGLIGALAEAPERGVGVLEIMWNPGHIRAPRAYCPIPSTFYKWSSYPAQIDRLVLCPDGVGCGPEMEFPPNKFIASLNCDGLDHPVYGANLLALVGWFGAAKFGLSWFMEFCQIFGSPLRHGKASGTLAQKKLFDQMVKFGQTGILVTAPDADVQFHDAVKGGNQLPHLNMIEEANKACDILILGQTLTSSVSSTGGNRALGEVHENTENQVVLARGKYVAGVLNQQLVPAILELNLGRRPEHLPVISFKDPSSGMSLAKLDWVDKATRIVPVAEEQVYDWLDIPMPEEGVKLYQPPSFGSAGLEPGEMDDLDRESLVHAARKKKR